MAQAKPRGTKLGGLRPSGEKRRGEALDRAQALRPVFDELKGQSALAVAGVLNARGVSTPSGGRWHSATVLRVQRRLRTL